MTSFDGLATSMPTTVGVLQSGWLPLGGWRALGIDEIADVPAHSAVWASAMPNRDAIGTIPGGFGGLVFVGASGGGEAAKGNAAGTWQITRK